MDRKWILWNNFSLIVGAKPNFAPSIKIPQGLGDTLVSSDHQGTRLSQSDDKKG